MRGERPLGALEQATAGRVADRGQRAAATRPRRGCRAPRRTPRTRGSPRRASRSRAASPRAGSCGPGAPGPPRRRSGVATPAARCDGQPAAEHVVAVRRQPVAAPDQVGDVGRREAGRRAGQAAQPAAPRRRRAARSRAGRRPGAARRRRIPAPDDRRAAWRGTCAARRAPRSPGSRRPRRTSRRRRRRPRPDRRWTTGTGPFGAFRSRVRTRGGALTGIIAATLVPVTAPRGATRTCR